MHGMKTPFLLIALSSVAKAMAPPIQWRRPYHTPRDLRASVLEELLLHAHGD